jgi:hypothetical protein
MKSHDDIEQFAKQASISTDEAVNEKVLSRMHEAYANADRPAAAATRLGYWDFVFENRFARLAAAAVILLAVGTLVGQFGAMLSGGSVAWADVTQRFQSVPFFYASIYVKEDALAQPKQFELWMGEGGSARMRVGSQVVFGRDGRVTHAFDVRQRRETEADETAADIVRLLATPNEFSLDTVIQSISAGKLIDVTPAANAQAAIEEDLAVFDAQSVISPGWVRIYALRESKLPVGLRIWDPAEGFSVDALITYAKEQPDIFFDAEAFAEKMAETGNNEISLAYMFLKDPGGQVITPRDLWNQDK